MIQRSNDNNEKKRGLFIVFEGMDGSGKSTQLDILAKKLRSIGHKVYETAEPTNTVTGGIIRDTLSNNYKRDASELAALFLADRITHNVNKLNGINKYLDDGITVICDRYYYSSFAYQGFSCDMNWIIDMNLNCKSITKPDICIFIDTDVKDCKERVDKDRVHLEIFETDVNMIAKIREQFSIVIELLKEKENIVIVDGNKSLSNISDEIFDNVIKLM